MKRFLIAIVSILSLSLFAQEQNTLKLTDKVRTLDQEETGFKVTFETHAGIYHVNQSAKAFSNIHKSLRQSLEKKVAVSLKIEPTTLEILSLVH